MSYLVRPCVGPLPLIPAIEDPAVIVKILAHLGLPARATAVTRPPRRVLADGQIPTGSNGLIPPWLPVQFSNRHSSLPIFPSQMPQGIACLATDKTDPDIVAGGNDPFVLLIGLRSSTGWGRGMTPVFLDSGTLQWQDQQVRFDGVFTNLVFKKASLISAEKVSAEKIKIIPAPKNRVHQAESYLLALRDQFYPFRKRFSTF